MFYLSILRECSLTVPVSNNSMNSQEETHSAAQEFGDEGFDCSYHEKCCSLCGHNFHVAGCALHAKTVFIRRPTLRKINVLPKFAKL